MIEYNDIPDVTPTENVGIIAFFAFQKKILCVANTHLYWNPEFPQVFKNIIK